MYFTRNLIMLQESTTIWKHSWKCTSSNESNITELSIQSNFQTWHIKPTDQINCKFTKYVLTKKKFTRKCEKPCLFQKESPKVFYKKWCSSKFCKIHWKTHVPETILNKVAGLRTATLSKRVSGTGVFLWILRNF